MISVPEQELERLSTCDLCKSPSQATTSLFVKSGLPVVRCQNCRLIYVNPRLRQAVLWRRYSRDYFENEYLPQHGPYSSEANYRTHAAALQRLRYYAPTRGRLLDVGCAIGLFLAAAQMDGWSVTGSELSEFAADYAQREFGFPVTSGNIDDLNLPPASFDAITLWETIEHVQSPFNVIRKLAGFVRPGGVLAISTPNISSLSYRLLRDQWWMVAPQEHIYYFAPPTLQRLLQQLGFEVKELWTTGLDYQYLRDAVLKRPAIPWHVRVAPNPSQTTPAAAATPIQPPVRQNPWRERLRNLAECALGCVNGLDTLYIYAIKR